VPIVLRAIAPALIGTFAASNRSILRGREREREREYVHINTNRKSHLVNNHLPTTNCWPTLRAQSAVATHGSGTNSPLAVRMHNIANLNSAFIRRQLQLVVFKTLVFRCRQINKSYSTVSTIDVATFAAFAACSGVKANWGGSVYYESIKMQLVFFFFFYKKYLCLREKLLKQCLVWTLKCCDEPLETIIVPTFAVLASNKHLLPLKHFLTIYQTTTTTIVNLLEQDV
jgi:hypothetical protein